MTDNERIQAERNELNLLINKGVTIELERTISVQVGRKFLFFKKYENKTEKLKFTVKEPTLSTLDRIAAEQIDLQIDENIMSTDNGVQEARKMANKYTKKLAKIVALSVLGQDYVKSIQDGIFTRYEFDDNRLAELTQLFYENVTPSRLMQYVLLINTMSNLGDFTNSIRLMSAARTTMPIRIEEKQKA